MSNSTLATYTNITKNKSTPRNHKIDTITIHCLVGQWTAKQGCDFFANTDREVSSNYVIGKDGSIGLSVEEKDRSWCSSNAENDNRAITIEVASDTYPPYAVTQEAYAALLDLVTDICRRNNIEKLLWEGDKGLVGQVDRQNMTVHRWFAPKACPGDYLYGRHREIASEVNRRLANNAYVKKNESELYRLQVGAFSKRVGAERLQDDLEAEGFNTYLTYVGGLYKVQVGAYREKTNADRQLHRLKHKGFNAFIVQSNEICSMSTNRKSIEELAREVIRGVWGNGIDRRIRLTNAGYSYEDVQELVERLI